MKVLKFGGTSIGTTYQIKKVVNIINNKSNKIVVFSAFSSVTNLLSEFIKQSKKNNLIISEQILKLIEQRHSVLINELFSSSNFKQIASSKLIASINLLESYLSKEISLDDEKVIVAQGELLSVMIIYLYGLELDLNIAYIPALDFMKKNQWDEPDFSFIKQQLSHKLNRLNGCNTYITSGFICRDSKGTISNLGRGASDYTATIIGNVLNVSEIEIWTDIDGIHHNDPRYVEQTSSIRHLSFDEASELAYFGAKVLHPASITPAQLKNIPVIIKNTMNVKSIGTIVSDYTIENGVKAIASKDGITTIKIKSGRMMHAYGFLRRIFEVFENYKTSVDMLTTSEISVAMTIDDTTYLSEITKDLSRIGSVEVFQDQSIICIVGSYAKSPLSLHSIIESFDSIPIQMISFGASRNNISFVVNTDQKIEALNLLNNHIFRNQKCLTNG
jgi:aspartate kinase